MVNTDNVYSKEHMLLIFDIQSTGQFQDLMYPHHDQNSLHIFAGVVFIQDFDKDFSHPR